MKRAIFLVLAACGGGGGGATVVEVPPSDAPPVQQQQQVMAPMPMNPGEQWVGQYTCAQGETDLALHVDRVGGGAIEGVFEFSHSPSGAGGSYHLHGTITPDGNVSLSPGAWMDRPSGYVSVGMSGVVRGASFSGRIDNPSCGAFSLRRR